MHHHCIQMSNRSSKFEWNINTRQPPSLWKVKWFVLSWFTLNCRYVAFIYKLTHILQCSYTGIILINRKHHLCKYLETRQSCGTIRPTLLFRCLLLFYLWGISVLAIYQTCRMLILVDMHRHNYRNTIQNCKFAGEIRNRWMRRFCYLSHQKGLGCWG